MRARSDRRISSFRCPARFAGSVPLDTHSLTVAGLTRSSSAISATVSQGSSASSGSSGSDTAARPPGLRHRKEHDYAIEAHVAGDHAVAERHHDRAAAGRHSVAGAGGMPEPLLTAVQVAELLAVPKTGVCSMSRREEIPTVRIGAARGSLSAGGHRRGGRAPHGMATESHPFLTIGWVGPSRRFTGAPSSWGMGRALSSTPAHDQSPRSKIPGARLGLPLSGRVRSVCRCAGQPLKPCQGRSVERAQARARCRRFERGAPGRIDRGRRGRTHRSAAARRQAAGLRRCVLGSTRTRAVHRALLRSASQGCAMPVCHRQPLRPAA